MDIGKIKNIIPPSGFETQGARISLFTMGDTMYGLLAPLLTKYYPFEVSPSLILFKQGYGYLYLNRARFFDTARITLARALSAHTFAEVPEIGDYAVLREEIISTYNHAHPDILKKETDQNLLAHLKLAGETIAYIWSLTLHFEAADQSIFQEAYEKIVGTPEGFPAFLEHASLPTFTSYEAYTQALLEHYLKEVDAYAAQWIISDYYFSVSLKDVLLYAEKERAEGEEGKSDFHTEESRDSLTKNKEDFKKWSQTLSEPLSIFARYLQHVIEMRDMRREYIKRLVTIKSNLARELSLRVGLPEECIPFVSIEDYMTRAYIKKDFFKEIHEREEGYLLIFNDTTKEAHVTPAMETKNMLDRLNATRGNSETEGILRGTSAYRGVVQGTVAHIETKEEFNKFKEGDILITSMTRVEFVPLMKKAAAIVTDEGGITCHAAIVSRELKKPCIIGTKNATQVLKDGDFVEVNANEGRVTVLASSQKQAKR